jgi:hypothetical protein
MKSFVEFNPTHDSISKFIDGFANKEGKDMSLALYRNPAFLSLKISLCFLFVQQIRLTALRLFVVGHSYSRLPFNLPSINNVTILQFGFLFSIISLGKTTKDIPELGIPLLPALGNGADNYLAWGKKFTDFFIKLLLLLHWCTINLSLA